MKTPIRFILGFLLAGFLLWQCSSSRTGGLLLPADVLSSCTIQKDSITNWFADSTITENGAVTSANSLAFPSNNTNCTFYQWAERMFLWVTSKEKGKETLVMESSLFYNVSPADSAGNRKFIPHDGSLMRLTSHLNKVGANRLPRAKSSVGHILESEEVQATGDVLMSKNGSLVYYMTIVNDVYAWWLTGGSDPVNKGGIDTAQFPTTAAARDSICAYARKKGVKLVDSNSLAMEIKTSWVEAASLPDNGKGYIKVEAIIPTYDKKNPKKWFPNGERKALMALVGTHIAGATAGHPEMIWSTFEHEGNTPNAQYDYLNTKHQRVIVPQDTSNNWLFSTNASDQTPNISYMVDTNSVGSSSDTIFATPSHSISASNSLRNFAWGTAMGRLSNQEDTTSAASNSEIISLNRSVRSLLHPNDIRAKYLLIGATWTAGGTAPNGHTYSVDQSPGSAIGTSVLANSTMETYYQIDTNSCFSCHSAFGPPSLSPTGISHVFSNLKPLITFEEVLAIKPKRTK